MGPKYHLQAGVLTLFGCKILVINLMAAVDPLFRKTCVSVCIRMPTGVFIQVFRSSQTLWGPSVLFLGHGLASVCTPPDTGISLLPSAGLPLLDSSGYECPHCAQLGFPLSGYPFLGLNSTPQFFNSWSILDLYQTWDDVLSLWGS